jgi:chromosome segregation ATPase
MCELKGKVMGSRNVAQAIHPEEVDEMNMEERVGKLEVKVDHIQSDLTELKTDVRELRSDVKVIKEDINTQGKELRAEIGAQGDKLRAEVNAQGNELRAELRAHGDEITGLKIALEKFKGQIWVAVAVIVVMQLLTMGGVPGAIARAFKWP